MDFEIPDDAAEKAQELTDKAKSGIPWLESHSCPECGSPCETSYCYDRQEAAFYANLQGRRPSWYCESCDQHYRREQSSGFSLSPFRD